MIKKIKKILSTFFRKLSNKFYECEGEYLEEFEYLDYDKDDSKRKYK